MNSKLPFGLIFSFLISCQSSEHSKIEVIKFDPRLIDTLTKDSDTSYTEFIGSEDLYSADYYITKSDSLVTKILKDSVGNVIGLNKSRKGEVFFAAEYYPNGQIIGKTDFPPGKVDGSATYYYPDGRIKSTGQWHDFKQTGIWKEYTEQGQLREVVHYDNDGNIIKTDKIQNE